MPAGKSVGSTDGHYVELETLKAYLSAQYAGMGGGDIADHKFFGRRFGALDLPEGQNGAVISLSIPVSAIGPYLTEQYSGMGGADIAAHRKFLRNCPKVRVTELPENLQ